MTSSRAMLALLTALVLPVLIVVVAPAGEPDRTGPNVLLDISAATIQAMVHRNIDRSDPVDEIILDTPVEGKSRTIATVRAEMVPSLTCGAVDVVFAGRVFSRTVSIRPFVLYHTAGTTSLDVRRRIVIDAGGIRSVAGKPCAESQSTLLDITCRKEPDYAALRFARQVYERNQGEGDAESAFKAGRRASTELGNELAPALASASKSIGRALSDFAKAGLKLEKMSYQTTATALHARLRFASSAAMAPPPLLADSVDLGVRVHESIINTAAKKELAGKIFSLDKVDAIYEDVTQGLLLDGRKDADQNLKKLAKLLGDLGGKATSIQLAKTDPLTATFANGGFVVEIHIARIHDEDADHVGMRVKGTYQFENTAKGVLAIRKGPIQYLPAAPLPGVKLQPQTPAFLLLREVLFSEVMKDRLIVNLPIADALPRVQFSAPGADARNGWLAVGWKVRSEATTRAP